MKFNVKVVGTANVLANITMWQKVKFKKRIKSALNVARLEIENKARDFAPKSTGILKASIWSEMKGDFSAEIGDGVYYGVFQEFGHDEFNVTYPPQPFLRPAFEIGKKIFERELKTILK